MKCSQCQSDDIKVIESRDVADGQAIRRRRMCNACGYRFTTYERIERPQLIVIKNDGTRELFNRSKLLAGLYRACEKTPVTSLQLERVVNHIDRIGDVAKELAYFISGSSMNVAACADIYDGGKQEDDAYGFV